MGRKFVKVWYDAEGDYLEVVFERKEGTSEKLPTIR